MSLTLLLELLDDLPTVGVVATQLDLDSGANEQPNRDVTKGGGHIRADHATTRELHSEQRIRELLYNHAFSN